MSFEPPESFNIADYFLDARVREGRGDRVALVCGDERLPYRDVQALANRFANVSRPGLEPEQRVLIALPDCPNTWARSSARSSWGGGGDGQPRPSSPTRSRISSSTRGPAWPWSTRSASRPGPRPPSESRWLKRLLVVGDAGRHRRATPRGPRRPRALPTASRTSPPTATTPASGSSREAPRAGPRPWSRPTAPSPTPPSSTPRPPSGYRESDVTLSVPKLFFGYATGSQPLLPLLGGRHRGALPRAPHAGGAVRADPPPPAHHPRQRAHRGEPDGGAPGGRRAGPVLPPLRAPRPARRCPRSCIAAGRTPSGSSCSTAWAPPRCGTSSSPTGPAR